MSPPTMLVYTPAVSGCVDVLCTASTHALSGWLVDSGATDHITFDKCDLVDYIEYEQPQFLIAANGQKETIVDKGTVQVQLDTCNSFLLYNVEYVSANKKRLLSLGKAYYDGINVNIMGTECYITDSEGYMLGWAEHMFPFQLVMDLSIKEREVTSATATNFTLSCPS